MPVPPPISDPTQIETRLLIVAEMLDRAIAEVHRAMADIRSAAADPDPPAVPEESSLMSLTDLPPDDTDRPPAAAALRNSLEALIVESQALRQDVHSAETARRRANQINLALLGLLALFVAMLIAIGWQGNQTIEQSRETNKRIADCTTPGGRCYDEGRARTGQAIQDILKVHVYMAECARLYPGESGPEFDRKLEACIYERLRTNPTPAPPR